MAKKRKLKPLQDLPGLFDEIGAPSTEKRNAINFVSNNAEPEIIKEETEQPTTSIAPLKPMVKPSTLKFISLGSGSSGNCAYLGDDNCGILIDAGIDNNKVVSELARNGISMEHIKK